MSDRWYSAKELAGLPGLPSTERRVRTKAKKEAWPSRPRSGRGGGREYSAADMPESAAAALALNTQAPAAMPAPPAQDAWASFERLPEKTRAEAARRHQVVSAVERLVAGGASRMAAYAAAAKEAGESQGTVRRWATAVQGIDTAHWLPALAPRYGGRTATAEISAEAWDYFKADYLRLEAPGLQACYERLGRAAAEHGWLVPSLGTLKRKLKREISRAALILARQGEEALKRSYPAQERDRSVFHALEAVNADGHTFDVFVKWPDGEINRPVMLAWQDVYSGKLLAWRIDKTENADAVRLSFGDMVAAYGIPSHAYLDNGRGFASKWITGGAPTRYRFKVKDEDPAGILTQTGVEVHWVTPYHGQAKPIERAFRDLCEYAAKHPALSGAYTGNSPSAKPENYASRAVPLAEFLAVLETEIAAHNARPGRASKVCAGRSFDQAFAESYAESPIRKASPAQTRIFMLAAESVRCDRLDASVKLLGNRFHGPALDAHAGTRLAVRFDPQNLQSGVSCYRLDGAYIGEADCLAPVGFNDTQAAREHSRARTAKAKATRVVLKNERRMSALEAANFLPSLPDAPPPDSKVVRPLFGGMTRANSGAGGPAPLLKDEPDIVNDALARALKGFDERDPE